MSEKFLAASVALTSGTESDCQIAAPNGSAPGSDILEVGRFFRNGRDG
jgi:hypothetical protein